MPRSLPRPRVASEYKKYGSMRVLPDGRVRFSAWTLPSLRDLEFLVVPYQTVDDYRPRYVPHDHGIDIRLRCQSLILLGMHRYRVQSACVAFNLSPEGLREAVPVLRTAGNGIESWIVPALEYTQGVLFRSKDQNKRALRQIIPELLESVRALPVAEPWKRRRRAIQREWEEAIRKNPEEAAAAPAPWVLERIQVPSPRKRTRRGTR
jgi:hypothetical protein